MSDFQVFVSTYNNTTRGEWLDPTDDGFDDAVARIAGNNEPLAADYEGFAGFRSESVTELRDLARFVEEHDAEIEVEAFIGWMTNLGERDLDAALDAYRDAYQGQHDSEEEFAEQLFRDCHTIPAHLDAYIDWERVARDLFLGDYVSIEASDGGVYVFSNH